MEESAKRRERLKAMRMESSQAGSYNEVDDSAISHNLSNPLIETSITPPVQHAAPRFDYYTDPMAAFSSDKRSKVSNQISPQHIRPPIAGPRNPEMTPSAGHQVQTNYSPDQRMYPARSPHHRSGPYRSPMATPSPAHQARINCPPDQRMYQARSPHHSYGPYRSPMATPSPAHQAQTNYPPDQRMYQSQSPHHSSDPYRSPMAIASPFGAHQGTPGVWNGSGGTSNYGFPYNSPRGGNFPSAGPGQGGSPSFNSGQGRGLPYDSPRGGNFPSTGPGQGGSPNFHSGQGRGHWFSNSPSPSSGRGACSSPNTGRGKGRWSGSHMSPGSGRSGGRGFRSHNNVSAELRPDLYYNKSMVEDPWEFLEPVPWKSESIAVNSLNTPDSQESWVPKSISVKKPRVSEASNHHSSQPSLAEYLAASFNEAADHKPKTDEPSV